MVDDIKFEIDIKVENVSNITNNKKSFSDSVEKTENEKADEVEKISTDVMPSVLVNMLMAYPEIVLGVGIGAWSGLSSLYKKIFKGKDNEPTDTNISEPSGSGITKPEPYQEPTVAELDLSPINVDNITGEPIISETNTNQEYDMGYNIGITYTDNSDEAIDHLNKINSMDISGPIKEWKNDFSTAASDEKTIIKDNLTTPLNDLNKVIKEVVDNKKRVDNLNVDIKNYNKKISKKRKEKRKSHSKKSVSHTNEPVNYNQTTQATIRSDVDHQSTKNDYFKYAYGESKWQ